MKSLLKIIISSLMLCVTFLTSAAGNSKKDAREANRLALISQREHLSASSSTADSLKYYLNIYDLSTAKKHKELSDTLLELARRLGNVEVEASIIRDVAESLEESSERRIQMRQRVLELEKSETKDKTTLFVKMMIARWNARNMNHVTADRQLQKVINEIEVDLPENIFERVLQHYRIVVYLRKVLNGTDLRSYFDAFLEDVDKLPRDAHNIRKLAYYLGMNTFLQTGDYEDAAIYAKKNLRLLDEMDKYFKSQGRNFKNMDIDRYNCYKVLLKCYPVLSSDEIEYYYQKVKELKENNSDVADYTTNDEVGKMFYLYIKGRYNEVIPMLTQQLEKHTLLPHNRRRYLEMLIMASSRVNDTDVLHKATNDYIEFNNDELATRSFESYRKLQLKSDISAIHTENTRLIKQMHEQEIREKNNKIIFGTIGIILLLVVVLALLLINRRNRLLTKELASKNKMLQKERDALEVAREVSLKAQSAIEHEAKMKSDFFAGITVSIQQPLQAIVENSNLIVDCLDSNTQPYLSKFAELVELNVDILNGLTNDLLTLIELHEPNFQLNLISVNVNRMCSGIVESLRKHVNPGVELRFIPDRTYVDPLITTAPRRVEQVLIQLLSNAIRFTEVGFIELTYWFSSDRKEITFSVTDSGIGIPDDKADVIFDRYVKLDKQRPGLGIGLTIAKQISDHLAGSLILDTTYRQQGARFLFTIPCV